jgi:glyoxylase-like metal-dependent hydrolase (beta-lactamase superfamily II)
MQARSFGAQIEHRERLQRGRALADPIYEVYALRYGARSDWSRAKSYLNDTNPNAPDSIEYFLWIIRNAERTIVVDTGFDADTAKRYGRTPFDDPTMLLDKFGVRAADVETVIVTHMHFDHVGALPPYAKARFHVQQADMAYATGPSMKYEFLRFPYDRVHVAQMLDHVYSGRAVFRDGDGQITPGVSVHRIDGHAIGLQAVRVNTARGWVVLASDCAAYIEQFADYRVSPAVVDAQAMLRGYDRLRELASSEDHIITGHDPITSLIYPKVAGVDAPAFRLDAAPSQTIRAAMAAWNNRKIGSAAAEK